MYELMCIYVLVYVRVYMFTNAIKKQNIKNFMHATKYSLKLKIKYIY